MVNGGATAKVRLTVERQQTIETSRLTVGKRDSAEWTAPSNLGGQGGIAAKLEIVLRAVETSVAGETNLNVLVGGQALKRNW